MKKAVIYARVSTKEQDREGFSIPAQLKLLVDYALKNNIEIVKEFIDTETAKQAGRTSFNEMLKFLKSNKDITTILVEKTDRLYRNFNDYVLLDENHYEIHLVKEGTTLNRDSRSHEKFIHGIKVLMAKNYIDNLKEETLKGMREKALQGEFPCKAPVGYKNITNESGKKIIILDENKALYVRRAFELYATGSYSIKRLNDKLYEEGFRTNQGKKNSKAVIERILKNIFYTGVFEFEGKRFDNAKHKAIISTELYYLVQAKLRDPRKAKTHNVEFPYTNLIRCEKCGCFLTAELKKGQYIYYHCTGNKGGDCKKDYVRQETLEKGIAETLLRIKIPQELIEKVLGSIKDLHKKQKAYSEESAENIEQQIKTLQKRIEKAYMDKLDGNVSNEFWKQQNDLWHSQKDELINRLKVLSNSDKKFYESSNLILEFCKDAYELFLGASAEEKRNIVNLVCSNLLYKDKELSIELNSVFNTLLKSAILIKSSPGKIRTYNPSVNSRMLCH